MGWLFALGIVLLLAVLPLGVRLRYNSEGMVLKIIAGPVKITLLPRPTKKKKEKKKKEKKSAAERTQHVQRNLHQRQKVRNRPAGFLGRLFFLLSL